MSTIHTLLIANRGEIARRIMRTAREMGIRTVAVYADVDRTEPHVREADVAVPLIGTTRADTYLDVRQLLEAAAWQGADAVHPGYGFLAESSAFARAVHDAGLIFVGPPPDVLARMGDKLRAKEAAADAGLPVLDGVVLGADHPSAWAEVVEGLGYPLLVKAAGGGGGRGMRRVDGPDRLVELTQAAAREAGAAFGDATVFAEPLLPRVRHIEIQVVADRTGAVSHLGERECSIQRRHQKLVEEAPSTALGPALRAELTDAAVTLTRSIGFEGLGTVELLVEDASTSPGWWFLEMNPRLQVEHPVTEAIHGLDLVRLQLDLAAGLPLPEGLASVEPDGHAVEVRVCAEDPRRGWLPSVEPVLRYAPAVTAGLRHESSIETGSRLSGEHDSLLVKVIAHAATRTEAVRRLVRGLRELEIHGPTTNRDYLIEVLTSEGFEEGRTATDFVERFPPDAVAEGEAGPERAWQHLNTVIGPHLAAVALIGDVHDHATGPWGFAPSGWRNVGGRSADALVEGEAQRALEVPRGSAAQLAVLRHGDDRWEVAFARLDRDHPLHRRRVREGVGDPLLYTVSIAGPAKLTTVVELEPLTQDGPIGTWMLHFGRRGQRVAVHRAGDRWFVNAPLGQSDITVLSDQETATTTAILGTITAPLPGRIIAVHVTAGQIVTSGDALVSMEAMKVEHHLVAPAPARVRAVSVTLDEVVDIGAVVVELEPVDPVDGVETDDG